MERVDGGGIIVITQLGQGRTSLRRIDLALLDSLAFLFSSLLIGLLDGLLDLLSNNTLKTRFDLSTAIAGQGAVRPWDPVPQEEDVEQNGDEKTEEGDDPDDQREQHGEVDDGLLLVAVFHHLLDVDEELLKVGAIFACVFTDWDQLGLHDSVQCHAIDGNTRSLGDDDEQSALELEVDEKGNIVGTLLGLGEFGKDKEAAPALAALSETHTLPDGSKRLEVAFRHTA